MPPLTNVSSLTRAELEALALNLLNAHRQVHRPITVTTLIGHYLFQRQIYEDFAFKAVGFAVGTGGYYDDPFDPALPLPETQALEQEVYRGQIDGVEEPTESTVAIGCRIPPGVLSSGIGELAIIAEITYANGTIPPLPSSLGGHTIIPGFQFFLSISHFAVHPVGVDLLWLHRVTILV
jgi:hypothetical protein